MLGVCVKVPVVPGQIGKYSVPGTKQSPALGRISVKRERQREAPVSPLRRIVDGSSFDHVELYREKVRGKDHGKKEQNALR